LPFYHSQAPVKEPEKPKEEKLEPAKVKVQIYFQGDDEEDEEGNIINKGTAHEVVQSKSNMSYTFCYDSESYKNFKLTGTGKELTLIVKCGTKTIFKKEGFELTDKMNFTSKDFTFEMGENYTVELRQQATLLFTGKIASEGCM